MAKVKKALRREKGSGGVYKARGYFYLQYTPEKGKRKAVTLRNSAGEKITDFREAEIVAAEFLRREKELQSIESREQYLHEVAKVKQLRAKLMITMTEAFDLANGKPNVLVSSEKNVQRKRRCWSDFSQYLRDNFKIGTIDEVTPSHAEQYVSHLRSKGYWDKSRKICLLDPDDLDSQVLAPKTINRVVKSCRWVFNQLARDLGYSASDNPFCDIAKLKEEPVQREVFTDDDLRAIFRDPSPLMEGLFTIGLCTGLREGDVATLRWREIITYNKDARGKPDFYVAEIERVTRKTKAAVSIPVEKELADFLSRQWEISGNGEYVLPEAAELYFASNNSLSGKIIKYLQSIGIQTKIKAEGRVKNQSVKDFHSLRHSFCYYAGLRGVPLPIVQSIVGHMNPKMTMYYQKHADRKAKQEGLSMMNGLLIGDNFGSIKQISDPLYELRQEVYQIIGNASEEQLLIFKESLRAGGLL